MSDKCKIIIAGGRDFSDYTRLEHVMWDLSWDLEDIIIASGGALGADLLGERFAWEYDIEVEQHMPNWDILGKGAGFMRNVEMAVSADTLIAFWNGVSRGTKHMIDTAHKNQLEVHVYPY